MKKMMMLPTRRRKRLSRFVGLSIALCLVGYLYPPSFQKPKLENNDTSTNVIRITAEGEKYVVLGKKRRATIRAFKGIYNHFIRRSRRAYQIESHRQRHA